MNIEQPITEESGWSGVVRSTVFDVSSPRAYSIEREMEDHVAKREALLQPLREIDFMAAKMRMEGVPEAFLAWAESPEGRSAIEQHQRALEEHGRIYHEMVQALNWQYVVRETEHRNLICVNGRAAVAGRLANITTYTGIINYGAVGTGATAADVSDTQLQTEIARTTVATSSQSTSTAYVNFLFTMASFNTTATEFGTVIDGTGSANTGRIWTHLLPGGGWLKTSTQSMVVACTYANTYVP